jgi:hypothetical protein
MIAKTEIQRNLKGLDTLYKGSKSQKHALYYSKLAILELCGWIEQSMDDLVKKCAKRSCKQPASLTYIDQKIKRTYGFEYQQHFQDMLVRLFGIISVEKVEGKVDPAKLVKLKAQLDFLKKARDAEAHTWIKGTAKVLDAPSVTLARFPDVYDGLVDFEKVIRKLKF